MAGHRHAAFSFVMRCFWCGSASADTAVLCLHAPYILYYTVHLALFQAVWGLLGMEPKEQLCFSML